MEGCFFFLDGRVSLERRRYRRLVWNETNGRGNYRIIAELMTDEQRCFNLLVGRRWKRLFTSILLAWELEKGRLVVDELDLHNGTLLLVVRGLDFPPFLPTPPSRRSTKIATEAAYAWLTDTKLDYRLTHPCMSWLLALSSIIDSGTSQP